MNAMPMTCDRIDALLADFFEGDVDRGTRLAIEAHLGGCLRCAALVRDLEALRRGAAGLPELAPSRDLWQGIAARIEAPVIPFVPVAPASSRSRGGWRLGFAAAALVLVTSGVTYTLTVARHSGSAPGIAPVASASPTVAPASDVAPGAVPAEPGSAAPTTVTTVRRDAVPATVTYDREIAKLRTVLDVRRQDLDPATVAIVEHSLSTIDRAIGEARAALAQDSASAFLMEQLNQALEKKLGLLRTVALLPARS